MKLSPSALALAAFSIAYPILAMIAIRTIGPWPVVGLLCAMLVLRSVVDVFGAASSPLTLALLAVAVAVGGFSAFDAERAVRLYPVFMNAAMLTAFALTLARPPSMIERFARVTEPDLPPSGVRYTRHVTTAWCLFFIANGSIALWTALFADLQVWALYNGLIAYLAMGALFAIEFVIRGRVKARDALEHS